MLVSSASRPRFSSVASHPTTSHSERIKVGLPKRDAAMSFKEIAAALGTDINSVRADFDRGMRKLAQRSVTLRLLEAFESERHQRSRHFATPYARTMRVSITDAPAHELTAPTAEVQP